MISVTFTDEDTPQAIKILQDAYEALQKINPHFTMEKADVDEYEEWMCSAMCSSTSRIPTS